MAQQKWYPSKKQLTPEHLEQTVREMLRLHYTLQQRVDTMQTTAPPTSSSVSSAPDNPATQLLCGIPVTPVDTNSLADGATLKYVKARKVFKFS